MVSIVVVEPALSLLDQVIALGDRHRYHLGFFPEAAFRKSAADRQIIAAVDAGGALAGYALYYVARSRVVLQHLCVDEGHRGAGIARTLVDDLKKRMGHLHGISLHCRRDFPAHPLWPRLGFCAVDEKTGRGKTGETLTSYWLDFGHADLMSAHREALAESKHVAVLDANVVYDLLDPERAAKNGAAALLAPWLAEEVCLWVTDEIFNEIDRGPNAEERKRARDYVRSMPKVLADPQRKASVLSQLTAAFPQRKSRTDAGDHRQLACAIAAEAPFFITRDAELLGLADELQKQFGIALMPPEALVLQFDESLRQAEYAPARLGGSAIKVRRISTSDLDGLADQFLDHGASERKFDFHERLRRAISDPRQHDSLLVLGTDATPLAMLVLVNVPEGVDVAFLRVTRSTFGPTLARNLALQSVMAAIRRKRPLTVVSEPYLSSIVSQALPEVGFENAGAGWIKMHLSGVAPAAEFAARASLLASTAAERAGALTQLASGLNDVARGSGSPLAIAQMEKRIWPARFDCEALPTFVVPIQARWAEHLFDAKLADQGLFGAAPELSLNTEHVYYRGARPAVLRRLRAYCGTSAMILRTAARGGFAPVPAWMRSQ